MPGWLLLTLWFDGIMSDLDAAESMNAVVDKLGGLAQPG
jgi:hypothetical protein